MRKFIVSETRSVFVEAVIFADSEEAAREAFLNGSDDIDYEETALDSHGLSVVEAD